MICSNFNSHAHVGRDVRNVNGLRHFFISTHTPTWGVTRQRLEEAEIPENFNSHAHVGRDAYYRVSTQTQAISTHTPTWGVTLV